MSERYLPLRTLEGTELSDLIFRTTRLDFGVEAIVPQRAEDLVTKFAQHCEPLEPSASIKEKLARTRHISGFLSALKDFGFVVTAGVYKSHSYEVDDSDGSMPIVFGEWEDVVLVVRVSSHEQPVTRAYVDRTMDKYTNSSDPILVED